MITEYDNRRHAILPHYWLRGNGHSPVFHNYIFFSDRIYMKAQIDLYGRTSIIIDNAAGDHHGQGVIDYVSCSCEVI